MSAEPESTETKKIAQSRIVKFFRARKRIERRILVRWVKFSREHQDSHILPFAVFGVIFLDGFVMLIPGIVILMTAVTISSRRWALFAFLFALAAVANNAITYCLGRVIPASTILGFVDTVGIEVFWKSAEEALQEYGSYATLIGGLLGLPTQLITALVGISDSSTMVEGPGWISATGVKALSFGFFGHLVKSLFITALTRYGWINISKKIEKAEAEKAAEKKLKN